MKTTIYLLVGAQCFAHGDSRAQVGGPPPAAIVSSHLNSHVILKDVGLADPEALFDALTQGVNVLTSGFRAYALNASRTCFVVDVPMAQRIGGSAQLVSPLQREVLGWRWYGQRLRHPRRDRRTPHL
jgi:hypothetical protein